MITSIKKWFSINAEKITKSIAFYPAIIAIAFLILSYAMLYLDFSDFGKKIKSNTDWIAIADANTARSIISTIAGAIISLTVFSFSMVMIVLNQAASHMSNRVLNSMIANRFQQIILGFYIGTIVYSLFLLTTIKDTSNGIYIPVLSIYLLILLTVIDIFLFIYFLNYVTQTVKYETVINRVWKKTKENLVKECTIDQSISKFWSNKNSVSLKTERSDYFQDFQIASLIKIAKKHNFHFEFLQEKGYFFLNGMDYLTIFGTSEIDKDLKKEIVDSINFYSGQPIEKNSKFGFTQLTEVALKALSPGINDPATAIISLNALSDLLGYKLDNFCKTHFYDEDDITRIYLPDSNFSDMFTICVHPIWHYGKEDLQIQNAMLNCTKNLLLISKNQESTNCLQNFLTLIEKDIKKNN
ncbi:DUF2254 domain-containing protein [Frigoriflavimonas asaccharolytica]|uniref:Putative membrane protein n=1 Tax=Frigoriflavimonas asaccharolytica TaxID=2735899 RepID=A0A8J8GAE3_9FLAO|nr:DUF2254 domain-containing protein [Frigoriflavimonas asaccharolytica]NRS92564.1 putative membrane protein [Frigoriflavimonas asaccharolytica]